jgi:lactate racemase
MMESTDKKNITAINPDSLVFDADLPDNTGQRCSEEDFERAVGDVIQTLDPHIKSSATVCIIVDDYTRFTPTAEILSFLIPSLEEKGIQKEHIFFLFASGSHRLMKEQEKRARLSDFYFENYRSYNHRFFDKEHLVKEGTFDDGAPIYINKMALEADIRIAVGTLVPHMPAGFSGGAKMLLPGVAGGDTVHHMHVLGALDPQQAIGVTDTLPRKLMEDFAAKTAEPFAILNVILNAQNIPVGVVGGHYIEAHRRGVVPAKKVYFVEIQELADLVISDTRGHDADMTQANKGLFSAALAVKEGGAIVLVTDCPDGVSPVHGKEMLEFGRLSNDEVVEALKSGAIKDPMSAIEILHNNEVRKKAKLYLYSPNITKEEAEQMNFEYVENLEGFIESYNLQEKKTGRLRSSTFIVPYIKSFD